MFHSGDLNPDRPLPPTICRGKKTINVLTTFSIFYKSCVKIK